MYAPKVCICPTSAPNMMEKTWRKKMAATVAVVSIFVQRVNLLPLPNQQTNVFGIHTQGKILRYI